MKPNSLADWFNPDFMFEANIDWLNDSEVKLGIVYYNIAVLKSFSQVSSSGSSVFFHGSAAYDSFQQFVSIFPQSKIKFSLVNTLFQYNKGVGW